jgi:hypothetical protein
LLSERAGVKDAVKLMDFGIAKLMESEAYQRLTRTGQIVGTPSFMAPEQARGEEIDGRADLYALGVVMYSALANRLPYDFENAAELLVAIQEQPPVPLTETAVAVQAELWEQVIAPALSKDREERFATAHDMLAALRPFLRARTGDMEEIRVAEAAAARAQPRPVVPAPAALARAKPTGGAETIGDHTSKRMMFVLAALIAMVLLVGMGLGALLTMKLMAPRATEEPIGSTDTVVDDPAVGVREPETAPANPTLASEGLAATTSTNEDGGRDTASGRSSGRMSGRRMRRRDESVGVAAPAEADETCAARVMLAATTSTGYTRDVARAVARPHVPRAALCLRGAHPRQVMITLDVNMQGHIGSAIIGGPHTEAEARCLTSIFAHTRLPARPAVPGPLVLTLAAAGCE